MLTVQAIRKAVATMRLHQAVEPYVIHVHPSLVRDFWTLATGISPNRHPKAGSARGRKRALIHSWRPVNGIPASTRVVRG